MIHFQGLCKYELVIPKQGNSGEIPDFKVLTQNERRYNETDVSYVQYVELLTAGKTIRLDRGGDVYVDDVLITLDASYPGFDITRNGRFVRVETDYGLVVESDGEWTTLVQIPDKFRGKVYGLCGDADGNTENDLTTKDGSDMTGLDNMYTSVGDSYRVDTNIPCMSPENDTDVTCSAEMQTLLDQDGYCNLITDLDGVFGACSKAYVSPAGDFRSTCRYDVCVNAADSGLAKMAACRNMEAFARMCAEMGYEGIDWRGVANCPIECGVNMLYAVSTSACSPTCENPDAVRKCSLPDKENCICSAADMVVKDGACVSASTCGCTYNGRHFNVR
ncbi:hypothetical protein NP493_516g02020 [Ridgeia piscesae]|uniref:VWFD domain-containing protein n=1 Tax=Ridgeia piscesae TaxID=27915 RepID=A0AAD9NQW0_RIDPI|nr:hypothetical protein NP493_516g02020 [Ridgeia piscesae]